MTDFDACYSIPPVPDDWTRGKRNWETYWIMVSTCNSLNSLEGLLCHRYVKGEELTIDESTLRVLIANIIKAQTAIRTLIYETGRMEEYDDLQRN